MNGTSLHAERDSWLRANGWTDPGELEAGHYLFLCLESEMSSVRSILYPGPEKS